MLSRVIVAALVVLLAVPAHAVRAVIVIRHAEKAPDPGIPAPAKPGRLSGGIALAEPTASHPGGDPELSLQGEDRAIALTRFMRHNKVDAIFTSELKRTKATASVIARQRSVVPVVVNADDSKGLVAKIQALPEDAVVLVVGHSNTVPLILTELGVTDKVTIRDDEFGRVFVVTPTKSGRSGLLEFGY